MRELASGFGLVESPRWHGGRLWFADWTAGEIRVLDGDSTEVVVRHESLPLCFDFLPDGSMLIVSSATRTLLRRDADGALVPHADLTPLSQLGANDIVVDGRGNAYVNSNDAEFGATAPAGGPATGRVLLVRPDGSTQPVADDLDFPNGMAVTADNTTLVVAESYRHRLTAFDIAADGSLSGRRVFADLGDDPPDGISIDADGAVWYADVPHAQCVRVAEGGEVLDRVGADRGVFACVLGDDALYLVGARWPGADALGAHTDWAGAVWSAPAPSPRAGVARQLMSRPAPLRTELPVLAAPMSGGPTTPDLVVAAARAGSLGFVTGGYADAATLAGRIAAVRASTEVFGVNLFAPNALPVDPVAYARYRDDLRADAERYGADLPPDPVEDDDAWTDKIELLVASPVPVVSFTFGIPEAGALAALRRAGSLLVQTVTSADEAHRANEAGVDALVVQAAAAGGHSATLTPDRPLTGAALPQLVAEVRAAVDVPLLATGGIADAAGAAAALAAGAGAVLAGTALLLAPEAGTSAEHRAALRDPSRGDTVLTRAFTGRPARALPNRFLRDHDAHAPLGYPALHHLTAPVRRAAAAAGDAERVHLWAGTGRLAAREQPVATTLHELSGG